MTKLKQTAAYALDKLKAGGADNAYACVTQSETREFNVDNGKFSLYRTLFGSSVSLCALKDSKKGSAAGNSLDAEAVDALCDECLAVAAAGKSDKDYVIAAENRQKDFKSGCADCDESKLFERSRELLEDIKTKYPLISVEQLIIKHRRVSSVYADLSGTVYTELGGVYSVSLMYSAHKDGKTSSFFGSGVYVDNLDSPFISLARIADELAEVQRQIETKPVEGKFVGTVICPPSSLGEIVFDALGNFAGGSAVLDGTTPWIDSIGKQVADSRLTVSLCPHSDRIVVGENVSGEGFLTEDCTIIKEGILQSFMLNRYIANKTGFAPAGNTSGNLMIERGRTSVADMVKGIKKGLWIGRLSGGMPASNGDFSAVAKNSFLIEDGEIKEAVSETMINGNLKDMLMNIGNISKETVEDGSTVLPYITFENVTISGK